MRLNYFQWSNCSVVKCRKILPFIFQISWMIMIWKWTVWVCVLYRNCSKCFKHTKTVFYITYEHIVLYNQKKYNNYFEEKRKGPGSRRPLVDIWLLDISQKFWIAQLSVNTTVKYKLTCFSFLLLLSFFCEFFTGYILSEDNFKKRKETSCETKISLMDIWFQFKILENFKHRHFVFKIWTVKSSLRSAKLNFAFRPNFTLTPLVK